MSIILWGTSESPYVRKVKVTLAEKELKYQQHEVLPKVLMLKLKQSIPERFLEVSPLGKVPAIEVDDFFISDSNVIIGYIDDKFQQGTKLFQESPEDKAKIRWFLQYEQDVLTPVIHNIIFKEKIVKQKLLKQQHDSNKVAEVINIKLPIIFNYLTKQLGDHEWLVGEQFSAADITIATHFISLQKADINIDKDKYPVLVKYIDHVLSRKSFSALSR